jgi:formamidopyrimidine-DNA glycosylase
MPELPEVETIVRQLRPVLMGKTFQRVDIHWKRSVAGDASALVKELSGRRILDISRRGKYICFSLDDGRKLVIHLRMSGRLVYSPAEKDNKHLRVTFVFCEDCRLHFIDMRKFGKIRLYNAQQELLPGLGPEPLDVEVVDKALREMKSNRAIKTLLLDQGFLAGIGNIYADEALFAAGIRPRTPAIRISKAKRRRLAQAIPQVLLAAIHHEGTTLSDYRRPDSESGNNQFYLKVYGREKQPCIACGSIIRRIKLNGRSAHFCPCCQR